MSRILPLVVCVALSCLHAHAGIERSTNGGETWEQVAIDQPGTGFTRVGASGSECADSVVGSTASSSRLQQQRRVPFANPGSNSTQQTFMRFINPNDQATEVEVYGIDDDGTPNRSGPISFTLAPQSSLQFTAQDMENGNTAKGLEGSFCDGNGKWQLIVRSDNSIEVMSLIRAPGGFLTSLNEVVPQSGNNRLVYFANSASEPDQQTFLRILNRDDASGTVTISAIDDAGNPGASNITLSLTANDSAQMTSQDLENGNTGKGLSGSFGDGEGNWRLTVTSTLDLDVMSLIRLPGGYLINLGAVAPGTATEKVVNYVDPADESLRTSSLRIINTADSSATITIEATDDDGATAPNGDVSFTLGANAAREISVDDLENGASDLNGSLGDGNGRWRMTVSSTQTLEVMSFVETADGFLTNLSNAAPNSGTDHEVLVFNPASNVDRRSSLRIVNDTDDQAAITISGYDDAGNPGDSDVTFNLIGQRSITVTAADLENGNAQLGLVGAFGDGAGKWRLTVSSDTEIQVLGTLDTPAGFITNLSRATEGETTEPLPVDSQDFYNENVSPIVQSKCIVCHTSTGVAAASALHYVQSSVAGYQATNYTAMVNYVNSEGGQTLLNKSIGLNSHGGGAQLTSGSSEFQHLSSFVALLGEEVVSTGGSGDYWNGVNLANSQETIRRASMILRGTVPTDAEVQAVRSGSESAMRATIRGMMKGDGFHEFLTRGANDRLLTDAFFTGLFDVADLNFPYYPVGAAEKYEAALAAGGDGELDYLPVQRWNHGLARAPVELIADIVQRDRNYQQVVTADYTMVNYRTNKILRAGASFDTEDPSVFKPGVNRGQVVPDDQLLGEFITGFGHRVDSHGSYINYPHAGVLNTQAYLARYPTTETNRNRARARWTYYHFLGVDIEKSAARTTDPVALADTNNPTMNNPACTACHAGMDPVAGAFQNYGNEGWYRNSSGGQDALPDTYKHPQWFDPNAEPSDYVQGDTWFRDMRTPGFEGELAPNPRNSLQWLGQVIAEDPRFASASVRFWWPALIGSEAIEAPVDSTDVGFSAQLAGFEAQNEFIASLGEDFAAGIDGGSAFNAKDMMTEIIMSPWFRAKSVDNSSVRARLAKDLGTGRLLTPEELEKKSEDLLGFRWGSNEDIWAFDLEYSALGDRFNVYYGGIDSRGITERSTALTTLMTNVAEKQALEMACPAVIIDFERRDAERLLFSGIDPSTTPNSESKTQLTIRSNSDQDIEFVSHTGRLTGSNKTVQLTFLNDYWESEDVNSDVIFVNLEITDSNNQTVYELDMSELENVAGATWGCGNTFEGGFYLWGSCTVTIPFDLPEDGAYTISLETWAVQAGPDLVEISVGFGNTTPEDGTSEGALALKEKLVDLHARFLGKNLTIDDVEIESAYQLLVESWQDRLVHIQTYGNWAWNYPEENCSFWLDEHWAEGGVGSRGQDPTGMKNTWMSVLIYIMTDFAYLHE